MMGASPLLRALLSRLPDRLKRPIRRLIGGGIAEALEVPRLPDLAALIATDPTLWASATGGRAPKAPTVMVATSAGGHLACATLEGMLAAALALRHAHVHVLLCDAALPACLECYYSRYPDFSAFVESGPQADRCSSCFEPASRMYEAAGFTVHRYSEFLSLEDRAVAGRLAAALSPDEMAAFTLDGLQVGEHAIAGALRFFARGDLCAEPLGVMVLRRYFEAAYLTVVATWNLLSEVPVDVAVFNHGIYVPQGLIGEVARSVGVRVVNWNPAYRKQCFLFSHDDTYHHTLLDEPVSEWENIAWSAALEQRTMDYLQSRWHGSNDWIWFHERPELSIQTIGREIGIDFARPTVGLLTNVVWDAQLHYPANVFPTMIDWLLRTIEYFATRDDLQLLVRVHPAEVRAGLPSRQTVVSEIAQVFPELPENVFVIPPESNVSTYAAMAACDSAIIFGTKTGVELASMGIPVIVAGEAWIRNKGITMDAVSSDDYFRMLDTLPLNRRITGSDLQRARMYAFHFFMRRMIPLTFMRPTAGLPPYVLDADSLSALAPGSSKGLDVVCDGILNGTSFVYPAEFDEVSSWNG
jgi:hypothetical protein